MLTPAEIKSKTFDKTFGRGYRMDDVESYHETVADSMSDLLSQNADLEKKLEILADKLTEYREDEESLRTALLGAQKLGDSVIRESKTKAEIIMRDATIKADTMINNAKHQIEREQDTLLSLQKEVASFKNRLIALYKQHLELVSALPGEVEERALDEKKTEQVEEKSAAGTMSAPSEKEPVPPESTEEENGYSRPLTEEENEEVEEALADSFDEDDEEPPRGPLDFLPDEGYVSDSEEEDDDSEEPAFSSLSGGAQSRFGELKFGEAFQLKRESPKHHGKKRKK